MSPVVSAEAFASLRTEVQALNKVVLIGNGKPGLVERVGSIETGIDDLRSDVKALNGHLSKGVWLILGTFLLALADVVMKVHR